MPHNPDSDESAKKRTTPAPPKVDQKDREGEEVLREQSKTETEDRPYLDTEGGE